MVAADPAECSFQFNPTGKSKFTSTCDIAKELLAKSAVQYKNVAAVAGTPATVTINSGPPIAANDAEFAKKAGAALTAAGYPAANDAEIVKIAIDPAAGLKNFTKLFDIWSMQKLGIIAILTTLVLLVTMVYGPMAAALVELFPTRIRYSGMSLPYHIGNGWFGGLLPATSFAMVAQSGDIYYGLWYPIIIATMTAVIGLIFVPQTHKRDLFDPHSSP